MGMEERDSSYIIDVGRGRYSSTLIKKKFLIYREIQTGTVTKS